MKTNILFLLIIIGIYSLCNSVCAQKNRITLNSNIVYRIFEENKNFCYPRISAEYQVSRSSSFELMFEYINLRKSHQIEVITYPISLGYKLNFVPLISKNEWFNARLNIYNSLRFVYSLSNQKGNTAQYIRYAPGVDYFINKHWGLNSEIIIGKHLRTTISFGIKYKL